MIHLLSISGYIQVLWSTEVLMTPNSPELIFPYNFKQGMSGFNLFQKLFFKKLKTVSIKYKKQDFQLFLANIPSLESDNRNTVTI